MHPHILIVGDSITLGAAEVRGNQVARTVAPTYVDHLRDHLPHASFRVDAAVLRTTAGLHPHVVSLLESRRPDILLLMLGGNDADIDWRRFVLSEGRTVRNNVPVERFLANLSSLAAAGSAVEAQVILVDVPNHNLALRARWMSEMIGRDVTELIERSGGQAESDRHLAQYNQGIRSLTVQCDAVLAPWAQAIETIAPEHRFGPDYTHPGERAHRVIAQALLPAIARAAGRGSHRRLLVAG
ncbi:MAG: SGNH/GDSL hydrolase family protein [Tepidisphaeraceae bacterium]|jgi:lysophospholipase L1-like esterase